MTNSPPLSIPDSLIREICHKLTAGQAIQHNLPLDGRLHFDRPLPFLCVYRQPVDRLDSGTSRLVTGEAAYLIVSSDPRLREDLSQLLQQLIETLTRRFGAFLLLEVWSTRNQPTLVETEHHLPPPTFQIWSSKIRIAASTVETFAAALRRIKVARQIAQVTVRYSQQRAPAKLPPLLPPTIARTLNCFLLGLEVQPIYRHPTADTLFPAVLRGLHRQMATGLKQTFFTFSQTRTTYQPLNYQSLGSRAFRKIVRDIDRKLTAIGNQFDFLLQVTPVNMDVAWAQFKHGGFETPPQLFYRPLPIDPILVKRQLHAIPVERVEDPTLALLFRQKQAELDRQLTMLSDRGTKRFLYGSLQLYGDVDADLKTLSEQILKLVKSAGRDDKQPPQPFLNAQAFAEQAADELAYYRQQAPTLTSQIELREDINGLMVSRGNLLIGQSTRVPTGRVVALLQHEIGTHVLTYFNGQAQPLQQLSVGLSGYEELQEGLAVLTEYLVGGLSRSRLRLLAARVIAAHALTQGASFVETFRLLRRTYRFKKKTAFSITARVYRGGGLVKDAVYLRGLVAVLKYLAEGGTLEPLFVGKIGLNHVPLIQELRWRQVLLPPPLIPRYMADPQAAARLEGLRRGVTVLDLV